MDFLIVISVIFELYFYAFTLLNYLWTKKGSFPIKVEFY